MAHFAELNQNNVVQRVIVVSNKDILDENGIESEEAGIAFLKKLFGHSNWKQTSYNNNFRNRYAGIGDVYYVDYDGFGSAKPKEFLSWVFNATTLEWEPPVPIPNTQETPIGHIWQWNESIINWELVAIIDLIEGGE